MPASRTLHDDLFARLDATVARQWEQARGGPFWRHVSEHGFDAALYGTVMEQIYHYTRHNSINQAVAALRADPDRLGLLRFVYSHAGEELGHERMVLHDLRAVGLLGSDEEVSTTPLPATEALIDYLYGVALRQGPVPRLGYSYWAESVYEHIAPLLASARTSLGLADADMSFFVAHAEIDTKHAEEVAHAIRKAVRTREEADAVLRVAAASLWLTIAILDQSYQAWAGARE